MSKDSQHKADFDRVSQICECFEILLCESEYHKLDQSVKDACKEQYPEKTAQELLQSIAPLIDAINEDRLDIVAKAAIFLCIEEREDDPASLKDLAKWKAYFISEETALHETPPTKADILEIMSKLHPKLYATIPTSKSGLRDWWKEVGPSIPQSRGYQSKCVKSYMEMQTDLALLIHNRMNHPDFPDE